jgi:hypothetical protein
MSETIPRDEQERRVQKQDDPPGLSPPVARRPARSRRTAVVAVTAVVVIGAGTGGAWYAGAFRSSGSSGGSEAPLPPATYTVARQDISATTSENGTLGYAASYTVRGHGSGTLTWLPAQGQVIRQGRALWQTDGGTPAVLLYGSVPAWRDMSEGSTGQDVTQLNQDLVALGYAASSDISDLGWDYYSWETQYAVQQLEEYLGVSSPSGTLPLGSVVFEPEALRVSAVTGSLGGSASGPVLAATSDRHVVTVSLDTSMESEVQVGDAVTVTLPDGSITPGVITSVGTVATGSGGSATIAVQVSLKHPSAAGNLDQAPVTVNITSENAANALVVQVGALLAQPSGGYAVEVVGADNSRRLVPVTVGIFDDADGLVQVTGALAPGERVVVPSA